MEADSRPSSPSTSAAPSAAEGAPATAIAAATARRGSSSSSESSPNPNGLGGRPPAASALSTNTNGTDGANGANTSGISSGTRNAGSQKPSSTQPTSDLSPATSTGQSPASASMDAPYNNNNNNNNTATGTAGSATTTAVGAAPGPPVTYAPFLDAYTADAALLFPDGSRLPCHSQARRNLCRVLAAWSGVVREMLQSAACCGSTGGASGAGGAAAGGGFTIGGGAGVSSPWSGTWPEPGSREFIRIPVTGPESLEEWLRVLELMYPPTRLPRPTIGWDNIDSVIVLADKYGMSGLLLLCEEFLLGRSRNGNGSGNGVFSCDPEDPAYVWKWLRRADRLRMERVCDECIDFICSEGMLGPGGGTAVRSEADEEALEGLRGSTLRRLIGRLVNDTATMKAALRNEGMKVSTAVSWSYAVGASGSSGATLTEHRRRGG
ncbi:hypothetical protein PLESTM_001323400 [Pleodorina starrii]|nr:hypothetical protein PLESTM_001323400 [Pleodorina starrii]